MNSPFAVISDIHSNYQALEAVTESIRREEVPTVYCLGDVVGYGADPNQCVEAVRELAEGRTILGNHDIATIEENSHYEQYFNPQAMAAIRFQQKSLSRTNFEWLESLPKTLEANESRFFHGSPLSTDHYVLSSDDVRESLDILEDGGDENFRLIFVGHSHVPIFAGIGPEDEIEFGSVRVDEEEEIAMELKQDKCYLINPGSVGQPRDRCPAASYVIIDPDQEVVRFKRVSYDINEAQRRILEAGLPQFIAYRLGKGF